MEGMEIKAEIDSEIYGVSNVVHIPLILSTRSAPHCPVNPLYAVHLSERSDACFYYIKEPVRLI